MKAVINQQNKILRHIIQKSLQINKLDATVKKYLDVDLRAHCQVANYEKGKLSIQVDSGAWDMQLRFQKMELMDALRKHEKLVDLATIHSFVDAQKTSPLTTSQIVRKQPQYLTTEAIEQLQQQITDIEDDTLRQAMMKLAECLHKPQE